MFQSNQQFVDYLIDFDVLRTPLIIKAFEKIDRADFVPPDFYEERYGDYPLSIGYGQTISQPTTVAFMLELLQPKQEEKILDVGSGSGWTTALLAHITGEKGKALGIELVPELVEFGSENLKKYNLPWALIMQTENRLGLPKEAPFDKILVSAAAEELPNGLVGQLKTGGRMVIPVKNSVWQIDKIAEGKTQKKEFPGFVFVPLK